jgi:peptide/nickel transport system ATP-binding protein
MSGRDPLALLEVLHLTKFFPVRKGLLKRVVAQVRAVDDVSLIVRSGETLGLVGESGCGKTTAGRAMLRLIEPTAGKLLFHRGASDNGVPPEPVDLAKLSAAELKPLRRELQIIFQDPYSSLNPRMTVREIVGEPLLVQHIAHGTELTDRVCSLLDSVGMKPEHMRRYPHEFSGGQRQRIMVARALALGPKLVVADEPVSALDVSIQAQVINLLEDLQQEFGLTYLFITHDLSVVNHISDRIAVMYLGKIVELAETDALFGEPRHPYTEALMSAVPVPDPDQPRNRILLQGDVPNPVNPPSGCHFHPRCRYAQGLCASDAPSLRDLGGGHLVACHFAETLALRPGVASS